MDGPDIDRLARSMELLSGGHDHGHDHDHAHLDHGDGVGAPRTWGKAPGFADDPQRAAEIHAATESDRRRYLSSGLVPVDCRHCHATVAVKKLGPEYTAVQWNAEATARCAYFAEIRAAGGGSGRQHSCPRLIDSIKHAVAEGCLEAFSSAPSPGDG